MTKSSVRIVLVILATALMVSCASTPELEETEHQFTFDNSLEETKRAAVDALTVLGFEIEEESDTYIQGHRPHKVGLLVGSGGETVGVWLDPTSEQQTAVKVDTAKSFVGYVGQEDWDEQIIGEMKKSLSAGS